MIKYNFYKSNIILIMFIGDKINLDQKICSDLKMII